MIKRGLEYITVLGILLCIGLFLYNAIAINRLSMQYDDLQEHVQQMMDNKEEDTQVVIWEEMEKNTEMPLGSYWESEWEGSTLPVEETSQYGLVKYGYLVD